MSGLYSWLQQTWSSLAQAADMSDANTPTEPEPVGCEIFQDALDQLTDELDTICDRIDFNLEQLWICRQAKAQAFGGIEPGRVNMTRQSISGAQRLLQTARSRVHQVIGEIEIVSTPPEAQQQATANE